MLVDVAVKLLFEVYGVVKEEMEAKIALKTQFPALIHSDKFVRRPGVSMPFSQKSREQQGRPQLISCHFQQRRTSNSQKHVALDPSGSFRNSPGNYDTIYWLHFSYA